MKLPPQARPIVRIPLPLSGRTGLGEAVKSLTGKLGIPACGSCEKRAELLDRWVGFVPFKD